ncbi:Tat pathway signal protein [Acidovorax sp. A1169]|uniref:Acg family FMN-binding oxidoreductase n=1 Tax=Acidovorax sp. A1169 TaxID=3059524 RepID=UPI002737E184|nr:Tat pathway signal protein [Acidovorax sp. A1169]MDP4076340.1 Tat pathway signal protein [Acidovorax sp. A1169]
MLTRRQFTASARAIVASPLMLAGCSPAADSDNYSTVAASIRQEPPASELNGPMAVQRELVRYATLAPSSHNTQCWKFRMEDKAITILPDLSRRCPAVDPDDHHLFVSLGCAAENLGHAALAHGFGARMTFDTVADSIRTELIPVDATRSSLFDAISMRQCTRGDFDGKPLSTLELSILERAGSSDRVSLLLVTERSGMERVRDFVVQGNNAQMVDQEFLGELRSWIRFSSDDAHRTRDGLFSLCSGNPTMPAWIGRQAFDWLISAKSENDKNSLQIRNSAGIAVFIGHAADKAHWIEVGRCYERFALQATALGVRNAFLNQPVEVASLRSQFAAAMGIEGRPDLIVRFGRGPTLPPSLRREVGAVLI